MQLPFRKELQARSEPVRLVHFGSTGILSGRAVRASSATLRAIQKRLCKFAPVGQYPPFHWLEIAKEAPNEGLILCCSLG
jgi:hypothetical protein